MLFLGVLLLSVLRAGGKPLRHSVQIVHFPYEQELGSLINSLCIFQPHTLPVQLTDTPLTFELNTDWILNYSIKIARKADKCNSVSVGDGRDSWRSGSFVTELHS